MSYSHADADQVRPAEAPRRACLRVWIDEVPGDQGGIADFQSLQGSIESGLVQLKAPLAWYSRHYPESRAASGPFASLAGT